MKTTDNPMHKAHAAPRCTAKSKRSGERCKSPAVRGKRVCRMHGAYGGAPRGEAHGMYTHGLNTREAIESKQALRALLRAVAATLRCSPLFQRHRTAPW
jgi:hypothetical protein